MSKRFWKILAIVEFVLIVLGVASLYIRIVMPGTIRELLSTLLCVAMLIGFLAGGTGWMAIIALVCEKKERDGKGER